VLKRELREPVVGAGGDGAAGPVESPSAEGQEALEPDRVQVRLTVPSAVRAAFDEVLDLHRAVTGSEASVASFIEALVAESLTEPEPSGLASVEGHLESLMKGPDRELEEQALERGAKGWPQLHRSGEAAWVLREAGASLERLRELMGTAGVVEGNGAGAEGDGARQPDAGRLGAGRLNARGPEHQPAAGRLDARQPDAQPLDVGRLDSRLSEADRLDAGRLDAGRLDAQGLDAQRLG